MVVGSQVALPGDTLYPVKRAIEDVSTSLAVGDGETGQRMLAHATERLEETEGLTQRSSVDAAATESSLRDFTTQADDGALLMTDSYADTGDESRIADLRDFTARQHGSPGRPRADAAAPRRATSSSSPPRRWSASTTTPATPARRAADSVSSTSRSA